MIRLALGSVEIFLDAGRIDTTGPASLGDLCRSIALEMDPGPADPYPERAIAEAIAEQLGARIVEDTGPEPADDADTVY